MGTSFDPVSFATGGAMDAASTWYNNRQAEKRQHEAQDFSAQQFATRYQTTVKDIKAAGLNPMLAYQQGGGSPPSSSAASSSGKLDLASATATTRLSSAQAAKIDEETENVKAERRNLEMLWAKMNIEGAKISNEIEEIDQRIRNGKATEEETKQRTELLKRQQQLTDLQTQLAMQEKQIKTPEQIASSTEGAQVAAHVSRVLKPLIDAINGALKNAK